MTDPEGNETFRMAVVQPRVEADAPEEEKLRAAVEYIGRAGSEGASLVLFPEGFPGPLRITSDYDSEPDISEAAREAGITVCWSRVERNRDAWQKVAYITGRNGNRLLRYERVHPATGDVHPTLSGTHLLPGESFMTTEVDGVRVGILICSELWVPEVARILALAGAEVILAPAGGGFNRVAPNWQLVTRARAIENQCYVAMTQHLFGDETGSAIIAGPEDVCARLSDAGMFMADLDLARVHWLRSTDDSMEEPKQFSSLPGLLRMRRPETYGELTKPRVDLYNYLNPPEVDSGLLEDDAFTGIDR